MSEVTDELRLLRMEIHTLGPELRAGFAEQSTRISTLTDSVADLRREYNNHSHPEAEPHE